MPSDGRELLRHDQGSPRARLAIRDGDQFSILEERFRAL